MTENVDQLPPAGWYPDHADERQVRWWDGNQWTEHLAPRPPEIATTRPPGEAKRRSRFMREFVGNKEEKAEAKAERLTARTEANAALKAKSDPSRRGGRTPSSHQGRLPSLAQMLSELTLEPRRDPLDEQVEVAGETYNIAGIKKVFRARSLPIPSRGLEINDAECVLVPEPWNPHDANAVIVSIDGHQVGHLPADLAEDYAGPLAAIARSGFLVTGDARVWAKDDGSGIVRARVTILIPEVELLAT